MRKTAKLWIVDALGKLVDEEITQHFCFSFLIRDFRISTRLEGASHLTSLGEMKILQILRITPRIERRSLSLLSLRAELPEGSLGKADLF